MYDSGDYTVAQIAKAFKTTRPTIYRALKPDTVGQPRLTAGRAASRVGWTLVCGW